MYNEKLLSEVIWKENSGHRIALGISENYTGFSFVTFDEEILLFDSELHELYLVLKSLYEKEV